MGDTVALAHFARARGLLWGEANAIKFIEGVVKKEKVLLELVKHNFPALHKKLRLSIVPTQDQAKSSSAAASEVLPSVPEGELMALSAGDGFEGGAKEARQPPAPRPSAAAAAAAPPLEDDDEEDEGVVKVGAAAAAPAAPRKKRPQSRGAGPRVDMSPRCRKRANAKNATRTVKRRKLAEAKKKAQAALLLSSKE